MQHVGRDELANHPYHFVDQVGDREEARDRQEGQKRREESEKEIVGLLRAEVERLVGEQFPDRALRDLPPAQRNLQPCQHVPPEQQSRCQAGPSPGAMIET